ncbi:hypothetical protein D3C76_1320670 [compost metagenome]
MLVVLPAILVILVPTCWLVSFSCEPLIASLLVAEMSPAATLVTFLLPALMPLVVTLGPPVTVSPFAANMLVLVPSVAIMELTTGLSAICNCMTPLASTTVFRFLPE